jgi:hypothetical protein
MTTIVAGGNTMTAGAATIIPVTALTVQTALDTTLTAIHLITLAGTADITRAATVIILTNTATMEYAEATLTTTTPAMIQMVAGIRILLVA